MSISLKAVERLRELVRRSRLAQFNCNVPFRLQQELKGLGAVQRSLFELSLQPEITCWQEVQFTGRKPNLQTNCTNTGPSCSQKGISNLLFGTNEDEEDLSRYVWNSTAGRTQILIGISPLNTRTLEVNVTRNSGPVDFGDC